MCLAPLGAVCGTQGPQPAPGFVCECSHIARGSPDPLTFLPSASDRQNLLANELYQVSVGPPLCVGTLSTPLCVF